MGSVGEVVSFDQRLAKCRERFEEVLAKVTKPGGETLDAVERGAFAGLMEVGQLMVGARMEAEAAKDTAREVAAPGGRKLPYHSHKPVTYRSVFGEVEVKRAYYWVEGAGEGHCPMDARLNLPARKDSYVLQECALRMGVAQSFDEMQGGLSELLGLEIPKRQLETYAGDAGAVGRTFYDEHQAPRPKEEGSLLVVQADGKGVPMKKEVPAEAPKRRQVTSVSVAASEKARFTIGTFHPADGRAARRGASAGRRAARERGVSFDHSRCSGFRAAGPAGRGEG